MPLTPGTRLGPYEIVGPLGAGGMGEVYRARDTRLNREVAIKVLPADVATDRDRLARFEREAQAVSALNHPNIVTLHEVGSSESGPYLVLERVDGQSLRSLVLAGPLPMKRLLDLAAQIAAGLAKAHSAGIVHRDLKPDNVMVTSDGFAKILDFGLARLVWPDEGFGNTNETATLVDRTATGVILGTLGYLSPEQAAGRPADYRADQFAFGALLYEMATGVRPFKRDTVLESLTATIRDEVEPVKTRRADLPAPLAWIIERCLAKQPDDRYTSTKDLARDLADLRDRLSEISRMPALVPPGAAPSAVRSRVLRWVGAAVIAVALVGATFVIARQTAQAPVPSFQPLTFNRGLVTGARFSPDGRSVYYSAAWGNEPSRIYVTQIDRTESKELGIAPGFLLSVSSKGELAVLLTNQRAAYSTLGILASVPTLGGTPRELARNVTYGDWAADGERIAMVQLPLHCAYVNGPTVASGCAMLRLSPVNDDVAFTNDAGVVIQDGSGKRLAHAELPLIYGIAWSRDGREVWLTGSETGGAHDRALYTLSLDGRLRLLARAPGALTVYDVGSDGKSALIATGAGWFGINAGTSAADERPLDLLGRTNIVDLSDDGTKLLLNETREVGTGTWLRSTDGTQRVQLSQDPARGFTPDGRWALVQPRRSSTRMTLLSTGSEPAQYIAVPPGLEALADDWFAHWSRDGKRLFIPLRQAGGDRSERIYVRESDGTWRPVTPNGVAGEFVPGGFVVSPDGDWIATWDNSDAPSVALYAVDGQAPRRLEDEHGLPMHWSADGRELYLLERNSFPGRVYRRDVATGHIEPWRLLAPSDSTGVQNIGKVLIANDERSYVYVYNRALNDLYLARDLR